MEIFKEKLPSGLGYAVKPSSLEAAMHDADIQTEAALYQRRGDWPATSHVFVAHFYPPGRHYRNQAELLTIHSRALDSRFLSAARDFIEMRVIPEFVTWVRNLERLPLDSTIRRELQTFERSWLPDPDETP